MNGRDPRCPKDVEIHLLRFKPALSQIITNEIPQKARKPRAKKKGLRFCLKCGQKFDYPYLLTQHEKFKHSAKTLRCHVCDRFFARQHELTRHLYIHTVDKLFCCRYPGCIRTYAYTSGRRRHELSTHSKLKLLCRICKQKNYQSFSALKRHLKIAHNIVKRNKKRRAKKVKSC